MTKTIVALIMSALTVLEISTGWSAPGVTPEWVETLLLVLNPILVWLVPGNWPFK